MTKHRLLYLLIVATAFGDVPLIATLFSAGGMLYQGGVIVALLLLLSYGPIWHGKLRIGRPAWPLVWYVCFLSWIFLTFLLNSGSVTDKIVQDQSELFRFLSQFGVILFGFCVALIVAAVYVRSPNPRAVCSAFLLAMCITVLVGLLQVSQLISSVPETSYLLKPLYYFFRQGEPAEGIGRVSALMPEPALLAIFYVTSLPFLFVGHGRVLPASRAILILLALGVLFFSNSRTAWVALVIQIAFASVVVERLLKSTRPLWLIGMAVSITTALLVPLADQLDLFRFAILSLIDPFDETNPFNVSNAVRSESMLTAIHMGLSHPFAGVGFGRFPFESDISLTVDYGDNQNLLTTTSLFARLLGETGFIGLFLWTGLWLGLTVSLVRLARHVKKMTGQADSYSLALAASCIGLSVTWLSNDSFGYINQYIVMGLCLGRLWQIAPVRHSRSAISAPSGRLPSEYGARGVSESPK